MLFEIEEKLTPITRLGLNKLFLWSEAQRFQTYPQALAKLTPDRTYTRRQIAEELFGLVYLDSGKARRENLLTNLFGGLQIAPDKYLLRGINLFRRLTPDGSQRVSGMTVWERADDDWEPTPATWQLAESYRAGPQGTAWQALLAEQLARYEPRTRALLHLLSHDHTLQFESPEFFAGNTQRTLLISQNEVYELFGEQGQAYNRLLFDNLDIAIGPWWRDEIEAAGFHLAESFELQGAVNRPPSTNYINSAMKTALYVFYALEILIEDHGVWRMDKSAFQRHLSQELSLDLLGEVDAKSQTRRSEWDVLAHILTELAGECGFVIAAEVLQRWGDRNAITPANRAATFDALIRRGLYEGRVEILERHPGQPRMGRGLLNDDNMRLVKLRVLI